VLDDDCYLTGDSLERAVGAAERERADLVSFRVRSSEDPSFEFTAHYRVGLLSFWGCAALVGRRAVDKLDGYDPNIFIWGNELEFTMRLLDGGLRHLFLPGVEAIHMKPPPGPFPPESHAIHTRNLGYVAAKLMQPRDAALAIAAVAARTLARPGYWRSLPALLGGARTGLRARRPVRPAVSSLYRRNFRDYAPPATYVRAGRYYATRADLYPGDAATLSV
jgi:GT2 family glycosyltransferase